MINWIKSSLPAPHFQETLIAKYHDYDLMVFLHDIHGWCWRAYPQDEEGDSGGMNGYKTRKAAQAAAETFVKQESKP